MMNQVSRLSRQCVSSSVRNRRRRGLLVPVPLPPSTNATSSQSSNINTLLTTRRGLSNNSTSFAYEYPLRTEAPIITRSVAPRNARTETAAAADDKIPPTAARELDSKRIEDHFDDANTLSPERRMQILEDQKVSISTRLTPASARPISKDDTFTFTPTETKTKTHSTTTTTKTTDKEEPPRTQITTLPNGIRIASQETYSQVTTFGILSNAGSRLETSTTTGASHLLELLAFHGTTNLHPHDPFPADVATKLESMGGVSFANASREQFLYCIDVLRPNVDGAMGLLKDVVLHPKLDEEDVEYAKKVVEYQYADMVPEVRLGEGLQMAAYRSLDDDGIDMEYQQLGRPHFCPADRLSHLTPQTLKDFRNTYLLNPDEMVVAAAGIDHDHLVDLAHAHFSHLTSPAADGINTVRPSTYTGGDYRQAVPTADGFTRIALAFPVPDGWHSTDHLVPACVLQTLLGGGNSFSAGGPGKGMYSRLYRQVLNRYYWAESCEAFTSFHGESGLFGLSGSSIPNKGNDMLHVLGDHMLSLERDLVSDEELERARNMLKCNVLTQLESRLVLFEDVGRQILTYGRREGMMEMCEKIEAVTKEDLRRVVRTALGTEGGGGKENMNVPTLSVVGDQVDQIASQDEVKRWFETSLF